MLDLSLSTFRSAAQGRLWSEVHTSHAPGRPGDYIVHGSALRFHHNHCSCFLAYKMCVSYMYGAKSPDGSKVHRSLKTASSLWNLLHVTLLGPIIWKVCLDIWKILWNLLEVTWHRPYFQNCISLSSNILHTTQIKLPKFLKSMP